MSNYSDIIGLVNKLYDSYESNINSDPAARASDSALSDCGINNIINNVASFSPVTSLNGSIRGYQYLTSVRESPDNTDSTPTNFDSTSRRIFGTATGGGGCTRGGGAGRGRY